MQKGLRQIKQKPGLLFDAKANKFVKITDVTIGEKYDTVQVAGTPTVMTAGTEYTFFDALANKRTMDCNLKTARRLSSGEVMWVSKVGFYFPQASGNALLDYRDMFYIADNTLFTLTLLRDKTVIESPMAFYPIGYGFYGSTTRTATGVVSMGLPSPNGVPPLAKKIYLNEDIDIDGKITFQSRAWATTAITQPTLSAPTLVKLVLHGRLISPATL